jgi:DNA replication protein DnaC
MLKMTSVPVLFLDDLGKEKMTDRMASVLFALIDQRTQKKLPTIITTNLTGDTLLERFHDKEIGAAFVARLKDPDLFNRVAPQETSK